MKADPKTEAEVLAVVRKFIRAAEQRDLEGILGLWAKDDDLVLFGTGRDEKIFGPTSLREGFQRDISQAESIRIDLLWTSVSALGPVAWVALESIFHWKAGGTQGSDPYRLTLVLERREDQWLFVQSHLSAPDARQPEGQSFPTALERLTSAVEAERPDLRAQAAPDGTVTILFTDIQGSTTLTERLGDQRWLEILRQHNTLVREQVRAHGCLEVKSEGDGFMIASQSARRAVQCAVAIQEAIARHNEAAPVPMRVRIGLHTGEVVKDADDFFGKHVILASRIANEAQGGQILVSSLLRELTESGGDIAFGAAREVSLRGLSGAYRVSEVRWRQ